LFLKEPFSALQACAFAVALLGLLLATLPGRIEAAGSNKKRADSVRSRAGGY
jgi:drug/metabolite transporter (DMT)-like permease